MLVYLYIINYWSMLVLLVSRFSFIAKVLLELVDSLDSKWCSWTRSQDIGAKLQTFSRLPCIDIEHDVRPSRNARVFDSEDVNFTLEGFNLPREFALRVINTLTTNSQVLSTSINLLSDRRLEVDSLVRHLKSLLPSTSSTYQDSE